MEGIVRRYVEVFWVVRGAGLLSYRGYCTTMFFAGYMRHDRDVYDVVWGTIRFAIYQPLLIHFCTATLYYNDFWRGSPPQHTRRKRPSDNSAYIQQQIWHLHRNSYQNNCWGWSKSRKLQTYENTSCDQCAIGAIAVLFDKQRFRRLAFLLPKAIS